MRGVCGRHPTRGWPRSSGEPAWGAGCRSPSDSGPCPLRLRGPCLPAQWPRALSCRRSQVIEKFEALDTEKAEHMETNLSTGPSASSDTRQGRSEKRAFPRKRVSVWALGNTGVVQAVGTGGIWPPHTAHSHVGALLPSFLLSFSGRFLRLSPSSLRELLEGEARLLHFPLGIPSVSAQSCSRAPWVPGPN